MTLAIYTGYGGSRFVADKGFGEVLVEISNKSHAPIITSAREREAEPLLRQIGKMSQTQLYQCFLHCTPACHGNCNPANPPGRSTHERRNDGVAYRVWPPGMRLPKWARGIDVQRDRVPTFCAEARKMGFTVTLTYPGSIAESQHVNFRKSPKLSPTLHWKLFPLHHGSRGVRVAEVIRLLHTVKDSDTGKVYLQLKPRKRYFGARVTKAVERFQHDHSQKSDGIVGIHTIRALRAAKRRQAKKK